MDEFAAYLGSFGPIETLARSRIEKVVARTMAANASAIPHVTHHDLVDVTALETYRRDLSPEERISPLIFIIKAVVSALRAFPRFNASLSPDGESLILKQYCHIGIAVDGPLGLLVPVLRDCDAKDLPALAQELRDFSKQAREKGLSGAQMSGGCFTISSLGGIGGEYFTPIINAPEVAILGVCGLRTCPQWDGHSFVAREMLPLSLSYDHRIINGADAARFVNHIGQALIDLVPSEG